MKKKLIVIKLITLFFLLLFISTAYNDCYAQTPVTLEDNPGFGGSGAEGSGGDGPTVPFDGGMSLLILSAGAGYLARKLKENSTATYESFS